MRLFRSRLDGGFKARSLGRDADTDRSAVKLVADAIKLVLEQMEAERTGLKRRIDDVTSRAALVGGNDVDEFVTGSQDRSEMLRNSETEMKRGQERLSTLEANISHFDFLRRLCDLAFPVRNCAMSNKRAAERDQEQESSPTMCRTIFQWITSGHRGERRSRTDAARTRSHQDADDRRGRDLRER